MKNGPHSSGLQNRSLASGEWLVNSVHLRSCWERMIIKISPERSSRVQSTGCSFRGPGFGSQHPWVSLQPSITSVAGQLTPSDGLQCMYLIHRHTKRQMNPITWKEKEINLFKVHGVIQPSSYFILEPLDVFLRGYMPTAASSPQPGESRIIATSSSYPEEPGAVTAPSPSQPNGGGR